MTIRSGMMTFFLQVLGGRGAHNDQLAGRWSDENSAGL